MVGNSSTYKLETMRSEAEHECDSAAMASSPVARAFALGATRRATELRERAGDGFADVLAAKLPATAVALLRKAKVPATIVLSAGGAELKVGEKTFRLGIEKHESAYDCYRENIRSRRWEDLGPIRQSLQPTRKRARQAPPRVHQAATSDERASRARDASAAARAMLGASGLADIDTGSDSQDDNEPAAACGTDSVLDMDEPVGSSRPRRGPGTVRLDRAVSAAIVGGRRGRGRGTRARGRGRTREEKEAEIISAARTALQSRAAADCPDTCDELSGIRAYNRAVADVTTKHALQMQLDAELSGVAAQYSKLSDQLASAQSSAYTTGGQSTQIALIRNRMASWERANANTVQTKLKMYNMVRQELLSLKGAVGKLANTQMEAEAARLRQVNGAPKVSRGAPARGRARGRPRGRGRGRVGRPRGSKRKSSADSSSSTSEQTATTDVASRPSASAAPANLWSKALARRAFSQGPASVEKSIGAASSQNVPTKRAAAASTQATATMEMESATASIEEHTATQAARAGARGIAARMRAKKAERIAAAARLVSAGTPEPVLDMGVEDVAAGPSATQWRSIDMGFEVTE